MLSASKLVAFVPTTDPAAARSFFYHGKLGLPIVSEDGFALVLDAHGTQLRVSRVQEHTPAAFTVLGWEVDNIESSIQALTSAGVTFERFPGLPQDDLGVWDTPDGTAKVAWFKDPEGNVLGLTQHLIT